MQLSLAVTQPSLHHGIFKCQSFPSHFFTLHILASHKHLFSSKVCLLSTYTDLLSGDHTETSRYRLFFCVRKYLFWREKTTKFKRCCTIQIRNNPSPKFRLYTVRQSPTTSRVDASIYFWFSSFSKFRNPICSREKSAVLLVNMYHCTEMLNKAGCYMSLNHLMHRHTVNSNISTRIVPGGLSSLTG